MTCRVQAGLAMVVFAPCIVAVAVADSARVWRVGASAPSPCWATVLVQRDWLLREEASGRMDLMRWSEQKSEQFQALRDAEAHGRLTEADRVTLDGLLADLDADEAEALQPGGERLDAQARAMDAEKAELDLEAKELARIAREEAELLADARAYVARLRQRSAALAEDFLRVTGRSIAPAR